MLLIDLGIAILIIKLFQQRQEYLSLLCLDQKMESPLRQITNICNSSQNNQNKSNLIKQVKEDRKNSKQFSFKDVLSVSTKQFNFGESVPTTVQTKNLSLMLKQDFPHKTIFTMTIVDTDEEVKNYFEYVFAIRKDNSFQFTNSFTFCLNKKGKYDFLIGVKTPNFANNYQIKSTLIIYSQFSDLANENQFYSIKLEQKVAKPIVQCERLLQSLVPHISSYMKHQNVTSNVRVLKFYQNKNKFKKQIRVLFKMETNIKITLVNELIGLEDDKVEFQKGLLEVLQKKTILQGKGNFVMGFKFDFPQKITNYLVDLQNKIKKKNEPASYTFRKILVMKVEQTSLHFHFPIQVKYFIGSKN